jgi:RNA polymerase sigma-70 factor (ECF subfamily)
MPATSSHLTPDRRVGSGASTTGDASSTTGNASSISSDRGFGNDSRTAEADAVWLRRAKSGDRAAFAQFVLASQDRLFTVLLRIVGDRDEARELAQDTYLRALQAISTFRGASSPYTWLYRIGVNLAIARLRKVRRQRTFSLDHPTPRGHHSAHDAGPASNDLRDEHAEDPAAAVMRHERDRQVLLALGRLDAEYRAVLVMRDVDDMDYKEISDVLELPLGTVKSRLFRARLALREELNRYFSPPSQSSPASNGQIGGAP